MRFDNQMWHFLYSCDLAGSERIKATGVEGDRLQEAQHINLSLLELGYGICLQYFISNILNANVDGYARTSFASLSFKLSPTHSLTHSFTH